MSFSIVSNSPQTVWCPLSAIAGTLYVGQLVRQYGDGVAAIDMANGQNDSSHRMPARATAGSTVASSVANNTIFGVVIGTNRKNPLYSSTYKSEYITFAQPNTFSNDDLVLGSGEGSQDRMPMVKVALIDPTTIVRGRIFNASYGTAPGVGTVIATTNSTQISFTSGTFECPTVACMSTVYFRNGNGAGAYRVITNAGATSLTFRTRIAGTTGTNALLGSKVVKANLRPWGISRMQVNSTAAAGLFIDSNASSTTAFYNINVLRLNLASSGNEYVDFQFSAQNCQPNVDSSGGIA